MTRHLEVLVVSEGTKIPSILNWKVTMVKTVEKAIENVQKQSYSVVAVSDSYNLTDKRKLHQILSILHDAVVIVTYDNENLSETVKAAYWKRHKASINGRTHYLDNSFDIKLANRMRLNN